MSSYRNWQYDEYRQVGKDYRHPEEVAIYDESHERFRDVAAENDRTIALLELTAESALADFGAGTGSFAIRAARICHMVYAVDVSSAMLEFAKKKAAACGVANIEFRLGGFLDCEFADGSLDAIVASFSLHHLPDFWKAQALERMARTIRKGGCLFLRDIVIEPTDYIENINRFVESQESRGGDFLRDDALGHFRDEFSTFDWILEGLLERAGFAIEERRFERGFIAEYLCRR